MGQLLSNGLLSSCTLGLALFCASQLLLDGLELLPLLVLNLNEVTLELGQLLLCDLLLDVDLALELLVEEVGSFQDAIVAERLRDLLAVGTFRTFVDEVVQEGEDVVIQALK